MIFGLLLDNKNIINIIITQKNWTVFCPFNYFKTDVKIIKIGSIYWSTEDQKFAKYHWNIGFDDLNFEYDPQITPWR